jgi:quercetin dioxygenase-like cupin family protein
MTSLVIRSEQIQPIDRGTGIRTLPHVGRWNSNECNVTTGVTEFPPGKGIPLHSHNVEETVLVVAGSARVEIGEESYELSAGDSTWVPGGVPHRFENAGQDSMRIFWVYGGRSVSRTIAATGETFEHLSEQDRVGQPDL